MLKRDRQEDQSSDKLRKRYLKDEEETQAEKNDCSNPSDLRNFIKNQKVIDNLKKNGIHSLFPIQYSTFNIIYKGNHIRAKDKTGSGKTLAFSLPIIERLRIKKQLGGKYVKFLVVLPTRQLVIQVAGNIQKLKLSNDQFHVVSVYGGADIHQQTTALKKGVDVIVATPGRLIDLANRGAINFQQILVTCLDEADEMLKQGFQQDVENIFQLIQQKKRKTQNLLFSATLPEWVKTISQKYQGEDCTVVDMVNSNSISLPSTITLYAIKTNQDGNLGNLVKKIRQKFTSKSGRCIIFCETKNQVKNLITDLSTNDCQMLHGDVKQIDRERVYRDFKSGKITTVIATNVAARGLDFPDIQLVIQVEPPKHVQSFVHRAGRTGRAGKKGVCVVICPSGKSMFLKAIQRETNVKFTDLREQDLQNKRR